jgi:hypothetical protein
MPTLGVATIKKKQRERILGGTESRKPILANVKTEVYKRAKGCVRVVGKT